MLDWLELGLRSATVEEDGARGASDFAEVRRGNDGERELPTGFGGGRLTTIAASAENGSERTGRTGRGDSITAAGDITLLAATL